MSALDGGPERQRLAEALKRLRLASGLTGYQLAGRVGVDQSTISKIERGKQGISSIRQVALWCDAAGASEERRLELLALAEDVLVGPRSWADASATGSTDFQRETQELEARTGLLSTYQPAVFPGPLQTPAYARRVFSSGPAGIPPDLAVRVMGRIERQRILYDETKRFRFVVPEAVLRWPFGPPDDPAVLDEHHEQLQRVQTMMARPNVEISILPLQPNPFWRLSGFVIYDQVDDGEPQVHL